MNELIKAINELKKEKNAIILGHYYQKGEIQDLSLIHISEPTRPY